MEASRRMSLAGGHNIDAASSWRMREQALFPHRTGTAGEDTALVRRDEVSASTRARSTSEEMMVICVKAANSQKRCMQSRSWTCSLMKTHDSVKAEAHMLTPAQQKVAVHTVDPLTSRFSAVQPRIQCCDTTMGSKVSGDQAR